MDKEDWELTRRRVTGCLSMGWQMPRIASMLCRTHWICGMLVFHWMWSLHVYCKSDATSHGTGQSVDHTEVGVSYRNMSMEQLQGNARSWFGGHGVFEYVWHFDFLPDFPFRSPKSGLCSSISTTRAILFCMRRALTSQTLGTSVTPVLQEMQRNTLPNRTYLQKDFRRVNCSHSSAQVCGPGWHPYRRCNRMQVELFYTMDILLPSMVHGFCWLQRVLCPRKQLGALARAVWSNSSEVDVLSVETRSGLSCVVDSCSFKNLLPPAGFGGKWVPLERTRPWVLSCPQFGFSRCGSRWATLQSLNVLVSQVRSHSRKGLWLFWLWGFCNLIVYGIFESVSVHSSNSCLAILPADNLLGWWMLSHLHNARWIPYSVLCKTYSLMGCQDCYEASQTLSRGIGVFWWVWGSPVVLQVWPNCIELWYLAASVHLPPKGLHFPTWMPRLAMIAHAYVSSTCIKELSELSFCQMLCLVCQLCVPSLLVLSRYGLDLYTALFYPWFGIGRHFPSGQVVPEVFVTRLQLWHLLQGIPLFTS